MRGFFSKNPKCYFFLSIQKLCLLIFSDKNLTNSCGALKCPVYNLAFVVTFVCTGKHCR